MLRAQLSLWRDNDARYMAIAKGNAMLEPALPVSAELKALAEIGLEALDAADRHVPMAAADRRSAKSLVEKTLKTETATDEPLLSFLAPRPPADLMSAIGPGIEALVSATSGQ